MEKVDKKNTRRDKGKRKKTTRENKEKREKKGKITPERIVQKLKKSMTLVLKPSADSYESPLSKEQTV